MRLMGMRFREFTWRDNPVSLRVENLREILETIAPFGESRAQELSSRVRKVTGEGYFAGEDCWEQWNGLQRAYVQKGPGMLQLPGLTPFPAWMDRLELLGVQGKNLVRYAFSFTERASKPAYQGQGVYAAQEGESLWDYANRWGLPVERLVECNGHLRDICCLKEGERVIVP